MSLIKFDNLMATKHGTNTAIVYELLWEYSQLSEDDNCVNLYDMSKLFPFLGVQEIELAVGKLIGLNVITVTRPDNNTLHYELVLNTYYPIILWAM